MSQFGGGGKPGWGRPGQPTQLPNFGGIGGVGSFGMMGMGVPVINPQAFSQPGMLGVGVMPAAVAQQQRPAANQPTAMPGNPAVQQKTRTFVGVVTKMHDSYGFVDDDVFFQHSVIRGQHPRVGEKVMVEASYNPQMPFKWNAFRIQLLSAAGAAAEAAQLQAQRPASPSPQRGQPVGVSSRWGPSGGNDRHGPPKVASPPRRRSPVRRSPGRRTSPPRAPVQRRKSPIPRRSPPPVRRSSPVPSRKRERSPAASTASSVKRDSTSPPRRRARIIPRYDFKQTKLVVKGGHLSVMSLKSRYNRLYIPSDFVELDCQWPQRVPVDSAIDLTNPIQFHVFNKEVDFPGEENAVLEPEDADPRHQVKVLLLAHSGKQEVMKKALGLLPDGSTDDNHEVLSIFKHLQFLVGTRGKESMAIGGSWSPSLDGSDVADPRTLIKTAIRTTKALTGVDLSGVPQWYSLVQLRYYRSDKDRMDQVHLLWPDTQLSMPSTESWETVAGLLRQQLESKLAAIDSLTVEAPSSTVTVADAVKVEEVKKEAEEEETEAVPAKPKPKATHWNDLDVKIMKVAELKYELEARKLETRGIKTLLCSRLQEALDKEQELEEDGPPDDPEVQKEAIKEEEVMEVDSTPAEAMEEENKVEVKSEAELKKETEEHQKKVDALEKEKTEKKTALEKHFTLPKEPKILVYPSKLAKSGKFDCKVTSLHSLLEYRHDDNKETQFEVSIFAEAFKELMERHAAFVLYRSLASSADRETERKRRDEAAVKPQENGETTSEEDKEKEERKEKLEKIELKGVVSNRALFEACAIFDSNLCGYFHDRDVEELIMNCDFAASRGQISRILQKVCGKSDRFTYRHLTDNLVDSDGNVRFEPGQLETPPTLQSLLVGFGDSFEDPNAPAPTINGTSKMAENVDTVIINGNVVNITQKLALLKKSEEERDASKAALNEQNSLLNQLRETKTELDKKKKDLEKELEKTKKKLSDTNSFLKASQDDVIYLRSAIVDCRRYSDRIASIADKAVPPPKKEEKDKDKKSEEKEKTNGEAKEEKSIEDEIANDQLVLSDETVANELVEVDTSEAHADESKMESLDEVKA